MYEQLILKAFQGMSGINTTTDWEIDIFCCCFSQSWSNHKARRNLSLAFESTPAIVSRNRGIVRVIHVTFRQPIEQLVLRALRGLSQFETKAIRKLWLSCQKVTSDKAIKKISFIWWPQFGAYNCMAKTCFKSLQQSLPQAILCCGNCR